MKTRQLNFATLKKVMDQIDDNGRHGRCGNWEMDLGGYDHGYEISYRGAPIGRVNYELREYELYDEDFIPNELILEFLAAIDARRFKDVGYHEQDNEDFDDDGPRYVQESIGNLESFLAEKEKKFKPSRVNPSWDESENKIWAVEDYLSMMGGFTDEDREYLRETDPELLSLEDEDDGQDMFNEARKQIMWAIDYRDFNSAIHGLIYGKSRRDVEQFYDRLQVIYADDDISPDEQEMCYQDLWDEFYPRIQQIDEINFRDIGKLPSGKYGIVIDDVEYRIVNNVAIDLYEESTEKQKMKSKKIVKEADEGYDSDTPKIYVGTYSKYNDGSIDGKWIDLTQYDTYEEFLEACYKLHEDEDDPEFMVQDYENFPRKWYHEGGLPSEEEFDKINEFYMMDDDRKEAYEAYVNYTGVDDFDNFQEAYQGHFDSPTDFAYDMVESLGWDGIGQENIDMYFDYDSFGRDLMYDFHIGDPDNTDSEGNPEDPDHYYDNDGYDEGEYESNTQVAEDYVDNLGGVDQLGQETMQNYFDYEAYGRDLLINDYFEEDGYIFRRL